MLAAVLAGPALADTVSLEPGMDRMGGDYKNFTISQNDPALCRKACLDDASCKAFTFVKPGIKGPAGVCFMKSSAVAATPNPCCTSGMKLLGLSPVLTPVETGGTTIPIVMVVQVIPPPYDVKLDFDPDQSGLRWQWGKEGCFPGAAGKPVTCPWIKDIEGFKVYNPAGKLIRTVSNPSLRTTLLGKTSEDCLSVKAYKGALESAASVPSCGANGGKVLPQPADPALAAPSNLRLAKTAAECSAATGGVFMGLMCDAAIKANGQALVFTWTGGKSSIDGFRLYDSYNGSAMLNATQANPDSRLFVIPALDGVKVSDWCFYVRSFEDERESKPSNTVCVQPLPKVIPPPPPPNLLVLTPAKGNTVTDVRSEKNFNNGCPWAKKVFSSRAKGDFVDGMVVGFIHKDKNILCGKRLLIWMEGDVEFPLADVPAKFTKATLKFTSGGTMAIINTKPGLLDSFGNPKTLNTVNCVREVFAYDTKILHKPGGTQYEYMGENSAYFGYLGLTTLATGTNTAVDGANVLDVTELLRNRLKAKKKKVGIAFGVDQAMYANQDMCLAPFHSFSLEIESKK